MAADVIMQSSGEVMYAIGQGCRLPELFNHQVTVDNKDTVDFDMMTIYIPPNLSNR